MDYVLCILRSKKNGNLKDSAFLPPAYEVRREGHIFSLSVCSLEREGVYRLLVPEGTQVHSLVPGLRSFKGGQRGSG